MDIVNGLIIPRVHLNGTSKKELLDQLLNAHNALEEALKALHSAWPNARDYYVQGPEALKRAEDEATSRLNRVQGVANEIEQIMIAVYDR